MNPLEEIAAACGGKIEQVAALPDGSGFAIMAMSLPKTHWIYQKGENGFSLPPPMPLRMPVNHPLRVFLSPLISEAGKYAVRSATMNGDSTSFSPDALIQNLIVGIFGYHTKDGLSSDPWSNPPPFNKPQEPISSAGCAAVPTPESPP